VQLYGATMEKRSHPKLTLAVLSFSGVRTTNLSTGFGFGASVVVSGLYLLPSMIGMTLVGFAAGAIARTFGSRSAAIAGSAITAIAFGYLAAAYGHPYDMLVSAGLLGVGIGLAFAALGNLVVQAVDAHQTGPAGGMNTVMRTIGGAICGQIVATIISGHTASDGLPAVTGFTYSFMFLLVSALAGLLVPFPERRRSISTAPA
jgi:MFS family permease